MGLGTSIDTLISVVSPGWGAKRSEARLRMQAARDRRALAATYGAAERSRLTSDWSNKNTSADAAIVPDMDVVNARARAAVRDDWAAAAIVSGFRRHVVGTGITCRANARDPKTGAPLTEFNKRADAIWKYWCRAQFCDLERRKSFIDFQSMLVAERVTVGEGFVIVRRVNDSRRERMGVPGIVLQAMEVEQLDRTTWQASNGNYVRNGIEIDKYGAAVAFHFYTEGHPLDVSGSHSPANYTTVRIPAEDVCHVMRVDRPRQTHGISRLAPILKNLRHLQMYNEYQLVAARMEACFGAAIESTGPVEGGNWGVAGVDGTTNDAKGNEEMNFEPGMFPRLRPGEKISWHDPQRPGDLYEPFVKAQVNQIATGAGLDYTTVVRDFTGGTYSGQRQAMIERDYEINPEQQDLIEQFCMPVRDAVIEAAILEGLLEAPGFNDDPEAAQAYLDCTWRPQAKPWIDPANQATAAETALKNRLTTHRDLLNEQAQDWREVFQQVADEEAELRRLGIQLADSSADKQSQDTGGTQ